MKTGVKLIAAERRRQITVEGWTPEHDDLHTKGEMAYAAACYVYDYAEETRFGSPETPRQFPPQRGHGMEFVGSRKIAYHDSPGLAR